MSQIQLTKLSKSFSIRSRHKQDGFVRSFLFPRHTIFEAVKDVSFEIHEGELVGFIGPNGAGKTTTLKMLSGLLYPTSGTVSVLGFEPFTRKPEYLRQISLVMGQKQQLWWELPVMDSFLLHKEIYDIDEKRFKSTMAGLVDLFEVESILQQPPRSLSLGQRMKCELIVALLHQPKVLFLDEPTIGLDVVMQQHLRNFIAQYNKQYGATIILTSHYMDDVRELCERVIMIFEGGLVYDGKLSALVQEYAQYKLVTLLFSKPIAESDLKRFGAVDMYDGVSARLKIPTHDVRSIASTVLKDYPVEDITIQEPEIEDVIRLVFAKHKK